MRLRMRQITAFAIVAMAIGQAGCATVSRVVSPRPVSDNPLVVPTTDLDVIWRETVAALDEYFEIRSENRLARTIVTDPAIGATLLEPWRGDTIGFHEKLESTLQTTRRFAKVQIDPVPGRGYAIKLEVLKELEFLARPERQTARSVFNNDFPVNRTREIVGPVAVPYSWIPRGRDSKLEQVILNRIRDSLFL